MARLYPKLRNLGNLKFSVPRSFTQKCVTVEWARYWYNASDVKTIRYSVHFPALILAIPVFWSAKELPLHFKISGMDFYQFGMMGALHATAMVVSLRDWKLARLVMAFCFIMLAAAWSAATPIVALWVSSPALDHLSPWGGFNVISLFLVGSAIGCSGYWLLMRLFWFESFQPLGWIRTVALCVAATLSCFGIARVLNADGDVINLIIMATWWFAFSLGVYWSEVRETRKRLISVAQEVGLSS